MNRGPERLLCLDACRGATIAAMLLVNNPGRWSDQTIFWPLRHATWNGWTPTDLVFPFFLFIVGVAMVFSFNRRRAEGHSRRALLGHVMRRSVVLILLGLFQNRFPFLERDPAGFLAAAEAVGTGGLLLRLGFGLVFVVVVAFILGARLRPIWLALLGAGLLLGGGGLLLTGPGDSAWFWRHLADSRLLGVLPRIGLCYLLAAGIFLWRGTARALLVWLAFLLAGAAVWMLYVPIPGFGRPDLSIGLWTPGGDYTGVLANWSTYLDTHLLGIRSYHHLLDPQTGRLLWAFDPESLASTPTAVATVLIGILAGMWLRREITAPVDRLRGLLLGGICLAAGGYLMSDWLPINKRLWTSSYAVLTGGLALLTLGGSYYLLEIRRWRRWAAPLLWYGRNPITIFLASGLVAVMMTRLLVPDQGPDGASRLVSVQSWLYENLFASWACPRSASLWFALGVVVIWALIAGLLHRRRIYLKI